MKTATITIPATLSNDVAPDKLAAAFVILVSGNGADGAAIPPVSVPIPVVSGPDGLPVPIVAIVPGLGDFVTYPATYHPVNAAGDPVGDPVSFSFTASLPTVAGVVASGAPTVTIS
jgi:hypothetical protein